MMLGKFSSNHIGMFIIAELFLVKSDSSVKQLVARRCRRSAALLQDLLED